MDPFNSNSQGPANMSDQGAAMSAQNGHKKRMLQHLIGKALGSSGQGIHETINNVKSAMGAYKNFSKEWDSLHGGEDSQGNSDTRTSQAPQMPTLPSQAQATLPTAQGTQTPRQPQASAQPQMPPQAQQGAPVPQLPPKMPQIASPMPSFLGGGNPPQNRF